MKLLNIIGLVAWMTSTTTSLPADTTVSQESFLSASDNTTFGSSAGIAKTYDVFALRDQAQSFYNEILPLYRETDGIMRAVFRKKLNLTNEVRGSIRSNLSKMAAHILVLDKELERNVAAMTALASPPGSAYKGISEAEATQIDYFGSTAGFAASFLKDFIAAHRNPEFIRPFLWKFASAEVLRGQANAKRAVTPLQKLMEHLQASRIRNGGSSYDGAINQINYMTKPSNSEGLSSNDAGASWYVYAYKPAPP